MMEGKHIVIGWWGHEAVDDVYGNWKYDGRVVLCRDAVQSLEVAQLKNIFRFFCFCKIEIMPQIATCIFPAK